MRNGVVKLRWHSDADAIDSAEEITIIRQCCGVTLGGDLARTGGIRVDDRNEGDRWLRCVFLRVKAAKIADPDDSHAQHCIFTIHLTFCDHVVRKRFHLRIQFIIEFRPRNEARRKGHQSMDAGISKLLYQIQCQLQPWLWCDGNLKL